MPTIVFEFDAAGLSIDVIGKGAAVCLGTYPKKIISKYDLSPSERPINIRISNPTKVKIDNNLEHYNYFDKYQADQLIRKDIFEEYLRDKIKWAIIKHINILDVQSIPSIVTRYEPSQNDKNIKTIDITKKIRDYYKIYDNLKNDLYEKSTVSEQAAEKTKEILSPLFEMNAQDNFVQHNKTWFKLSIIERTIVSQFEKNASSIEQLKEELLSKIGDGNENDEVGVTEEASDEISSDENISSKKPKPTF